MKEFRSSLVLMLVFGIQTAYAQWSTNSTGIYYNASGKEVAIGTTPDNINMLKIYGSNEQNLLLVQNNRQSDAGIEFKSSVSRWKVGAGIGIGANVFNIYDLNAGQTRLIINNLGRVGIGATSYSNFEYKLTVSESGSGNRYGIGGFATTSSTSSIYQAIGVLGDAAGSGSSQLAGIYGRASTGTNKWAGYFNGNVAYTGTITDVSDARLKEDIAEMDNGLEVILSLKPKTYKYLDKKGKFFDRKNHAGFLAQDVQKVKPELVSEIMLMDSDSTGNVTIDETQYLGVNYVEMIPYLVSSIQQQQERIESQNRLTEYLLAEVRRSDEPDVPQIMSLSPNPASSFVTVTVQGLNDLGTFTVNLIGSTGSLIRTIEVEDGTAEIDVSDQKKGVFFVSLTLQDVTFDTKRLIIK